MESKLMINIKETFLSFISCLRFVSFSKARPQISVHACENSVMACKSNNNPVHFTEIV
jgi:hypothetical protein